MSGRLSVALSLLRSTLGRDVESPIVAEGQRIGLNSDALDLDVIRFHRSAHAGLDLAIRDGTAAIEPLKLAVQAYEGDLLEEDRYATWIDEAREHLRGLYISATRALAGLLEEQEPQHALLLWLRVLDKDPYDEGVHHDICRVLIDSGRHGEALRRHRVYADRMAELDLPALPLSDIRLMRPA